MQPQLVRAMAHGFSTSITSSRPARQLLKAISAVTGIPLFSLLAAQRLMAVTGSVEPLKELLVDTSVRKADGLRWKLGVKHRHQGRFTRHERASMRFDVALASAKGKVRARIDLFMARSLGATPEGPVGDAPVARLTMKWTASVGEKRRAFEQTVTLTPEGDRALSSPAPQPLKAHIVHDGRGPDTVIAAVPIDPDCATAA
jgi:hypothetical protein